MRTFAEVNAKIQSGRAVVLTAGEFIQLARDEGIPAAARKVDVVTTATFGAMCSSGAMVNFGHADPPIRMENITLNDVPVTGGLAAVDTYIAATTPSNSQGDAYGGAHVIEDLIAGREVLLKATGKGTDCYPRKTVETQIRLADLNQAYLFNPRNAYQNYDAATNSGTRAIYTYMGILQPRCANVMYSTSGEYSPLLKDPDLRTIGMGTRIFFNGAQGYVAWEGTQAWNGRTPTADGRATRRHGYTLALIGDMHQMQAEFLRSATFARYGVTLYNGIGVPIPVLDEDLAAQLAADNSQLFTQIVDYGTGCRNKPVLREVSYAELRSGTVELEGRQVPAAPLASLKMAVRIAEILRDQIRSGTFLLNEPAVQLPRHDGLRKLEIRN